jgi:hypothetical protein
MLRLPGAVTVISCYIKLESNSLDCKLDFGLNESNQFFKSNRNVIRAILITIGSNSKDFVKHL